MKVFNDSLFEPNFKILINISMRCNLAVDKVKDLYIILILYKNKK